MARGFFSGVFWGTLVGGLGAATLSQVTELPPSAAEAPVITEQDSDDVTMQETEVSAEAPAVPDTDVDDDDLPLIGLTAPAEDVAPAVPETDQTAPEAPETPETDLTLEAPDVADDVAPELSAEVDESPEAPAVGIAPQVPEAPEAPLVIVETAPEPLPEPEPEVQPEPEVMVEEETVAEDEASVTAVDTAQAETDSEESQDEAEASAGGTDTGASTPQIASSDEEVVRVPVPEISDLAPNVTTNRLPSIGDSDDVTEADSAEDSAAEGGADAVAEEDQGALQRNAIAFENPDGKPVFSIVLIDGTGATMNPTDAAALPFLASFAIDATAPDASERARTYRAAGHEVLMMVPLPDGATASDVEVAYESAFGTIPEAVGVLDNPDTAFGSNRLRTRQIVEILAGSGHGLMSFDQGLNATQQVAARVGVPSALAYRVVDSDHESAPVIRRYLDRAAFRAQQEGQVIMVGHLYPDTIAALTEWALEDRAASLVLAPVSAVMQEN